MQNYDWLKKAIQNKDIAIIETADSKLYVLKKYTDITWNIQKLLNKPTKKSYIRLKRIQQNKRVDLYELICRALNIKFCSEDCNYVWLI